MVTAIMKTCFRSFSFQTAAKPGKTLLLHQRICPNIGRYSWSRFAKAMGPAHSIPRAHQTLLGNKRSFFSISLPNWAEKETCEDFPERQHRNTLIINSFPSDQLTKYSNFNKVPFTQLKICVGAMSDFPSADELRSYLVMAGEEYQSFDFQVFSKYSNGKKPFVIKYATTADFLLLPPLNYGPLGSDPQVAICLNIPLESNCINTAVNVMLRFNKDCPFSLGLNK